MSRTCRGGWRANQTSAEQPRLAPWDPNDQRTQEDTPMTKLHGQVAVITGATAGMALSAAKLFVTEGAHVYITGRRKDQLDDAVSEIGVSVTGVRRHQSSPTLLRAHLGRRTGRARYPRQRPEPRADRHRHDSRHTTRTPRTDRRPDPLEAAGPARRHRQGCTVFGQ